MKKIIISKFPQAIKVITETKNINLAALQQNFIQTSVKANNFKRAYL